MSKYLGKLLLDSGSITEAETENACVKYILSNDAFMFKAGTYKFCVGADLVFELAELKGTLECQYAWSTGYVVRPKKGIEYLREMRNDELTLLGGRRELIISNQLDNDYDFDLLCVLQYLYKFSNDFFKRVKGHSIRSKKYLSLQRKVLGKAGRKKGSKNVSEEESETIPEILMRCEHNMGVAVDKGFLEWYIEAQKEWCKAANKKFDKKKCLEKWNELISNKK